MKHFKRLAVLSLTLSACTTLHYESPQLAGRPAAELTIAVLPCEMVLAGRRPAGLGPDEIRAVEEAESLAFQSALYSRLLDQASATRKRPILARIQPPEATNRLLAERGIAPRASWRMPSGELAALLGVDAVLRTRIVKQRYLTDLESYGASVGIEALHQATAGRADWLIPPGLTRTHDVSADSSLFDGRDGSLLWRVEVRRSTDWRRPPDDVVVGITGRLARKFPYRG